MVNAYDEKYGPKVTFRVNPEKKHVKEEFYDNVINKQHSDVCYVLTSFMEIYNAALANVPNPDAIPFTLNFAKQNIQLNIGCQFHYNVKKSRRDPASPSKFPFIETKKNLFFPLLLDEWPTLSEAQKEYWRERLIEAGIIKKSHPSISTRKPRKPKRKIFSKLRSIVRQLTARFRGKDK